MRGLDIGVYESLDKTCCLLLEFGNTLNVRILGCHTAVKSLFLSLDAYGCRRNAGNTHLKVDKLLTCYLLGVQLTCKHLAD